MSSLDSALSALSARRVMPDVRRFVRYNQLTSRAAFQVLAIPFRIDTNGETRHLLFKRADLDVWQWVAGGGEDNEGPEQAARREAFEEAGIPKGTCLSRLDSMTSIPATHFSDRHLWGADVYVIQNIFSVLKLKAEKFVCRTNTKSVFG